MNDLLIFGLLFLAIAIGWFLGRKSRPSIVKVPELPSEYYKGLNYLLDGRPDGAIDAFISALEVNSETLDTHIALGNLLRKKGEVDRAIRVHQNLLARPSLPRSQVHQAHLELARDYISAGLLDRAERLLLDLVDESNDFRQTARHYLLEIYQSEREWQRAVDIAVDLLPKKSKRSSLGLNSDRGQNVTVALAHYYCELASEMIHEGKLQRAHDYLQHALSQDKKCVRASIMLGDVEYRSGNFKKSIKALHKVRQQDPLYIPETLSTLRQSYGALGDQGALKGFLQECLDAYPSATLMLALADDVRDTDGKVAAAEFLSVQLSRQPSLRGLASLIGLQMDYAEGEVRDNLSLLQLLVNRLVADRHVYRCDHCGFAARQLHWFCPGCKYWGTIKIIRDTGNDEWNHP